MLACIPKRLGPESGTVVYIPPGHFVLAGSEDSQDRTSGSGAFQCGETRRSWVQIPPVPPPYGHFCTVTQLPPFFWFREECARTQSDRDPCLRGLPANPSRRRASR